MAPQAPPRRGLFRRYTLYLALLLSAAVLASGGLGAYFAFQDARALVDELQREKARSAAARIAQFVRTVELQMKGTVVSGRAGAPLDLEARHFELLRLLRVAPAISDAAWLDASGHERVRVSRLARDVVGSDIDRSAEAAMTALRTSPAWYGEIGFRRQSEPYLAMAVAGGRTEDGAILADINLKFASDVVAEIHIGRSGQAYVVDSAGQLIVHPDASMALRRANLAQWPPVRAALAQPAADPSASPTVIASVDGAPRTVAAHARIAPLGWHVIVEQPLSEAFAPLFDAIARTAALLLLGLLLAVAASLWLARRMTTPIRLLGDGAQRIGQGHLDDRVEVRTGDELEDLADQFNRMAQSLRDSHAGLEHKVAQRTHQLAEANRAKVRFLAAASHDLRQPVHALGLFVAQLQEARDEATRAGLVNKVAASSTAVADLIEALLDISKLDAGAVAAQPTDFALQPLFNRIEQALALAAQDQGLRLRVRPTALWVRTDPLLLERILLNLCSNAIRYTHHGGAIVGARVRGAQVRIEVWDTGIGIAADQQAHIFEEFVQMGGAAAGERQGLGLGLAIVERLTHLLDLRLSLRSVPGRGSVFAVELPQAPAAHPLQSPLTQLLAPARFEGLAVWLIDDDALARDATEGLLTQWGCAVSPLAGGADALTLVEQAPAPQLIICDYHLGDGELGTALVAQLRARLGQGLPAVILSADASSELREAAGLADLHLLHKPLNAARLRALLLHLAATTMSEIRPSTEPVNASR